VIFVAVPFVGVVRDSLRPATPAGGLVTLEPTPTNSSGSWSIDHYQHFFGNGFNLHVLQTTFATSLLAALLTLLVAYPIAIYAAFSDDRIRRYVMLAVLSPLLISVVVRAYALTLLLGPNNPLDRILPGPLDFNILYSRSAVLVGLVYTLTAFMVISIVSILSTVDRSVIYAARTLGAGTWDVLIRVILPLSLPGVEAGFVLVFVLSATSFALPLLLGGDSYKMLVSLIYEQMLVLFDWPNGYAISIVLFAATGAALILARRFLGRPTGAPLQ
jgi:putative spermidine/putrescine transport system permease protein